jgi:hypothetical protein
LSKQDFTTATTRLLGLDGLAVVAVEQVADGGRVVHLATAGERARHCPDCGMRAVRVKEWITTLTCARRTFSEAVAQVPPGARITGRLRAAVPRTPQPHPNSRPPFLKWARSEAASRF